jgi:hypothetical protein
MTLGFISLLLTITARYISRICIPEGAADTMLPCRLSRNSEHQEPKAHGRRHLSEAPTNYTCRKVSNYGVVVYTIIQQQDLSHRCLRRRPVFGSPGS